MPLPVFMSNYLLKLKHVFPTFFNVTAGTVAVLVLIRWLFFIQFPLFDIKEEFWVLWIPLVAPWIPILLWLRPKLRVLTFKKDNDNGRFFFQFVAWGVTTATLIVAQNYLTTVTGKLESLSVIEQIATKAPVRYYRISNFAVAPYFGGSFTDFRTSGKTNDQLNFNVYFVTPILADTSQRITTAPKYWYGVKFHDQVRNRLSNEEKEDKYKSFYESCISKMNKYKFYALDHFKRTPTSDDKDFYLKAIKSRINQEPDKSFVVLEPVAEPYELRNGNKLAWIFGSFGIGVSVMLFSLVWPGYSNGGQKTSLRKTKIKKPDYLAILKLLIPRKGQFATVVILELNVLVFIIMAFSGVHIIYPNGLELLQWGANRRFETINGDWWRLFTSMFVHGGIMHLFMNIYGLFIAALFVEPILGAKKYFILYFISGLSGSLASIWWHENTISVGASGAIFGLYGAILGLLLTKAFPEDGKKGILKFIGIFVGLNLLMSLTGGIDNAAHLGGLISGAVAGFILYNTGDNELKNKPRRIARKRNPAIKEKSGIKQIEIPQP